MSTLNIYLEGLFIPLTLREAKTSKTSIPNQLKPLPHSSIKTSRKNSKKLQKKNDEHSPFFWSSPRSKGLKKTFGPNQPQYI
jgi:hypothetical protein